MLAEDRQRLDVCVQVRLAGYEALRLALELGAELGVLGDVPLKVQRRLAQPRAVDLVGRRCAVGLLVNVVQDLSLGLGDAAAEETALLVVVVVVAVGRWQLGAVVVASVLVWPGLRSRGPVALLVIVFDAGVVAAVAIGT